MKRPSAAPDGNSRGYALQRLALQRPDLHARAAAGELSAHAAMVLGGFRPRVARPPAAQILWVVEQLAESWERGESSARLAERLGVNRSRLQLAGGLALWNALEEREP